MGRKCGHFGNRTGDKAWMARRDIVLAMGRKNYPVKMIVKHTGVPRATVYDMLAREDIIPIKAVHGSVKWSTVVGLLVQGVDKRVIAAMMKVPLARIEATEHLWKYKVEGRIDFDRQPGEDPAGVSRKPGNVQPNRSAEADKHSDPHRAEDPQDGGLCPGGVRTSEAGGTEAVGLGGVHERTDG